MSRCHVARTCSKKFLTAPRRHWLHPRCIFKCFCLQFFQDVERRSLHPRWYPMWLRTLEPLYFSFLCQYRTATLCHRDASCFNVCLFKKKSCSRFAVVVEEMSKSPNMSKALHFNNIPRFSEHLDQWPSRSHSSSPAVSMMDFQLRSGQHTTSCVSENESARTPVVAPGFSNTLDVGQFIRTRLVCHVPECLRRHRLWTALLHENQVWCLVGSRGGHVSRRFDQSRPTLFFSSGRLFFERQIQVETARIR